MKEPEVPNKGSQAYPPKAPADLSKVVAEMPRQVGEDVRALLRRYAASNSYFLAKAILGYDRLVPRIHEPMCRWADTCTAPLTLGMAFRGSFKSTLWTITRTVRLLLASILSGEPTSILIFSEAALMAEQWSREARLHIQTNERLRWLFPELAEGAKWGDAYWMLANGSTVIAAGIDKALMGAHVNHLIMDDIFSDPKGDKTAETARRALQWVQMSLPLLKQPNRDRRYLIGVPWWVDGEPYAYYRRHLPASARFELPLITKDGDVVWPEEFPPDRIEEMKRDPFVFASQYLLDPISRDTAIFATTQIPTYTTPPKPPHLRIMTLDPAFSVSRLSSHTAACLGLIDSKGVCWIDKAVSARVDAANLRAWIRARIEEWRPQIIALEANGPQRLLFEELRTDVAAAYLTSEYKPSFHALRPTSDKVARWQALASAMSAKRVLVNATLADLILQLSSVTGARHEENDLVDAASYFATPDLSRKRPLAYPPDLPDLSTVPTPRRNAWLSM